MGLITIYKKGTNKITYKNKNKKLRQNTKEVFLFELNSQFNSILLYSHYDSQA